MTRYDALPALLLALSALGCPSPRGPAASPGGAVIGLPAEDSPFVVFRLAFLAGSADDPAGKEGLTQLAARLYAEGGTRSLSYPEILARLYPMSAELSVEVGKELTVFYGRVHKDLLSEFYPLLRDVVVAPRLSGDELERLRSKTRSELEYGLVQSDDEALGQAALEAMIYEGHPYGHPVLGTLDGLKAITLDDVKAHAAEVFTRDRLIIGVAGAYPAGLLAQVEKDLSALPARGAARAALPAPKPHPRPRVWLIEKDTDSVAISLGRAIEATRASPDFAALEVARSYLGEHRQSSGLLFQRLRGARGLNYGDYAYAEAFSQEGESRRPKTNIPRRQQYFSIWIRPVQPEHGVFALKAARWELDRLVRDGPPEERFLATRRFLGGYTRLFEETVSRRLGYLIDDRFYGLSRPYLEGMRDAWSKVSLAEVNAAAKRHMAPEGLQIAIVTRDAAKLKEALLSKSPTAITYASPKDASILAEDKLIGAYDLGLEAGDITIVPAAELFKSASARASGARASAARY